MGITQERFEQGLSYQAYREQMTRNQERFLANEKTVQLDAEDLAYFASLPQTLPVAVLAEDWCGDVIANLPVLGALAEQSGKLDVRVFLRDQNLDIMDQYLKEGQFRSIPVFVFLDSDFQDLGHWIERPVRVTQMLAQQRQKLFASDPVLSSVAPDTPFAQMSDQVRDRLREATTTFRELNRDLFDREVVRELRALVEQGQAQAHPTRQPRTPAGVVASTVVSTGSSTEASASSGVRVKIVYCADCGYEPQTLDLTGALMKAFIHELSGIELIPWQDGAFDVAVNGELIHSMYRDGGFPDHERVIQAVRERLPRG